ncbi:DNA-processing protein DprA [Taishania pollutisoli]|uniref:DNA-processing protein DprA n=1 Tax=Taishania pollutisoli TaxID=2766479 RepID=UPI001C1E0DD4|nr:DNA-processing protein DprA [Taishania pollutisoli]
MIIFKVPKVYKILIYTKPHYQIALTQLHGFGSIKTKQLLQSVENEAAIFNLPLKNLAQQTGFSLNVLKKMKREEAIQESGKLLDLLEQHKIEFIFYTDPRYPRRLKQCEDAPLMLYTKGNIDLNNTRFVAIVGTRDASEYGKRICSELIQQFAGTNIVVVSGMAYGIDITIHQLCLQYGVETIGVMAHGLEIIYPQLHRSTAMKMLEKGGLISEYPPTTKPDRENFPMRNRIVAGMCDATIVVESKVKGGSLITAELANDYNRDVFAYPGNIFDENSEGCNVLISTNKAHLIRSGADFLKKMGWDLEVKHPVQRSVFPSLTQEELHIVRLLETQGQMNIDTMAMQLNVPSSALSVLLFQLEMNGLIASVPGNRCRLV